MLLPQRDLAVVPQAKVIDYLLSDTHADGRHKARFFKAFGYSVDDWKRLELTLKAHITDHEVCKVETSSYGTRFVVEGIISIPDGRTPRLRTVWFVRDDENVPQFVTAYPLASKEYD